MNDPFAFMDMANLNCPECGINHCVPKPYLHNKANMEKAIYCPNGHQTTYSYPKPIEKPIQEKKEIIQESEPPQLVFQSQETITHLRTVFKGNTARAVNSGKCPECGENFKNLSAHILKEHL